MEETKNNQLENEINSPKVEAKVETKVEMKTPKAAKKAVKQDTWRYATYVLGVLLVLSLFANYDLNIDITSAGSSNGGPTGAVVDDNAPAAAPTVDPSGLFDDSDPMIGDSKAKVTIVEFSDYECPFCSRFYSQTLPSIMSQYVDTGKVNLVFRNFPLSFHQNAQAAALAAECANDQGKFWEFHDLIFENQGSLSRNNYNTWASQLGLDLDEFGSCVDSGKYNSAIAEDLADGQKSGVRGTPAFFINGVLVSGAQPFSVFQQAIEAALNS